MPKLTSLNIVVQALQIFRERIVGQLLYLLLHLNQSDKPKSQHLFLFLAFIARLLFTPGVKEIVLLTSVGLYFSSTIEAASAFVNVN